MTNALREHSARKRRRRKNGRAVYLERGPGGSEGSSVKPSVAIYKGARCLPYKATQEKRWNKVKALQRLLTHSFSGKALAVRRVTENQGKKTPGVDKVLWDTPEKKAQAIHDLRQRGYHPQPLRRVYIPKSNGAQRPLSIPTMKDRAMQALYLLALQPITETLANPHSYGFPPERCTADALAYCHILFSQKNGPK